MNITWHQVLNFVNQERVIDVSYSLLSSFSATRRFIIHSCDRLLSFPVLKSDSDGAGDPIDVSRWSWHPTLGKERFLYLFNLSCVRGYARCDWEILGLMENKMALPTKKHRLFFICTEEAGDPFERKRAFGSLQFLICREIRKNNVFVYIFYIIWILKNLWSIESSFSRNGGSLMTLSSNLLDLKFHNSSPFQNSGWH